MVKCSKEKKRARYMLVIPALERVRQGDFKFKASLRYIKRLGLKKNF
jgi:hypothetical protein